MVFLVVMLVFGLGDALAWALLDGVPGRALGLAGACLAAAAQLGSVSQRAGQKLSGFYGDESGGGVETELTGWLQLGSAATLVVAVGLMLGRPVWAWLLPLWQTYGGGRRTGVNETPADGPSQLGTAVMREPGVGGRAQLHDRPSVGFSDDERATGGRSRGLD